MITVLFTNTAWSIEIWDSEPLNFEKLGGSPDIVTNQDRITSNVWLTRGIQAGLYNIKQEGFYNRTTRLSPADTEWAFSGLNGNPTENFNAQNYQNLNFTNWQASLGGSGNLRTNIINRPGVVHLISDGIYIDIEFTNWGMADGAFAYTRADAPSATIDEVNIPNPSWVVLALAILLIFTGIMRSR